MMEGAVAAYTYEVEAPEGDAQQNLPLTRLVQRLLEVATYHAESWGVGYNTLIVENKSWVLARLAVEMEKFPIIGDNYTIETWIEGLNKHFSTRNFCIRNEQGDVFGYARSIWSVMQLETRQSVDITTFEGVSRYILDRPCPIGVPSKIRSFTDDKCVYYPIRYSDIDLNRHVNSVKYIEHLIDRFSLSRFDENRIKRFEINYLNEARYGGNLSLHRVRIEHNEYNLEIKNQENESICRGKIIFVPR